MNNWSYDNELDRMADIYNEGCVNYKNEILREEECSCCDTYCDNYLDTLSQDEIIEDLKHQEEYYEDFKEGYKKYPQYIKNAEKRIELLKSYLKGE
jgi:hypothetical protein